MDSPQSLPPVTSLSPAVFSFLDEDLRTAGQLHNASALLFELQSQCRSLDRSLSDLDRRLGDCVIASVSNSDRLGTLFGDVNGKLIGLRSATATAAAADEGDEGSGSSYGVLGEELPALAKEVARVEAVRVYAETALKLDSLVGDIEDAVSSIVNRNLRKHPSEQKPEEKRLVAIKALKLAEDVLTNIAKTRPQWTRLVSAVDHRVDRALAILRPQEIADYRSLLASLGWPPPLTTLNSSNVDANKSSEVANPLLTMQGDLKYQYCESFLALCSLQRLQRERKVRQLQGHNLEVSLRQPLWAIEELVNPISIASQRHFSKWVDKPEFIFTLAYKITRDYVDSMDELLQPLVDEAMLSGYSCREEWISAMVTSVTTYLAKELFPVYIDQLDGEHAIESQSQAKISLLHLVDLMIGFDKKVQSLLAQSGILLSLEEDGGMQKISSLSVFCDRPDWLDLWAEIELNDAIDKLKLEIEDERRWSTEVHGSALLSGSEDYKSPAISSSFLMRLSAAIERCRSIPSIPLRSRFVKLAVSPIIQRFLDCLLLKCEEAEGLTALADDDALVIVTKSINASHYFVSVLQEWSEDVFFLEMGLNQGDQLGESVSDDRSGGILDEEIGGMEKFRMEWVEKLSSAVLRGFDAHSRDYVTNRKQWLDKSEEGWSLSKSLVGALDYLQWKMSVLESSLSKMDFVGFWRSVASAIDRLFFSGILMSNVKFNDGGVERFSNDLAVLFGVFGAWCLRPESFFPKLSESLKLLKMREEEARDTLAGGEKWLKQNVIRHLGDFEVEKILKSRVYST